MNPLVVDLSHWQEHVDFAALKAGGTVGVILKCTEGTTYLDPRFNERYFAAMDAGLAVSTYHFLHHGSVDEQMRFYVEMLQPDPGERMCIDHEDAACSLDDLRQAVEALRRLDEKVEITVYGGHLIKDQLGQDRDPLLARTSLWIAHYTEADEPDWPRGTWPVWSLWQYTDVATAEGVEGAVDGNCFNGSIEQCLAWFGPADVAPPAPPEPKPLVLVQITQPPGVKVSVVVNGEILGPPVAA